MELAHKDKGLPTIHSVPYDASYESCFAVIPKGTNSDIKKRKESLSPISKEYLEAISTNGATSIYGHCNTAMDNDMNNTKRNSIIDGYLSILDNDMTHAFKVSDQSLYYTRPADYTIDRAYTDNKVNVIKEYFFS